MENIRSFGSRIVSSAAFACLCLGASADSRSIMAVQIDLARQKETPSFVSNYMARVRAAGYNTMVLYLEDRVKTASYPYPADADSYSTDEMAALARYGTSIGLDVVPVVSPLGHTERFLAHPELAKFGEQCDGVGRWGKTDNPGCFCLENPEARAWMEKYISEVSSLFPGGNLHFGFDETWNLGFCSRCRPIVEKEGLAELYMRHVKWAHALARRLGKRMWMWDDFFEFFDPGVLETVPRDILMCQWNYDRNIERTGPRAHFGTRERRDILKTYERLGIDSIVSPWFDYENVRTFTEYASSRKCAGFFFTQWEMETDFHSIFFPRVLAAAELWSGRGSVVRGDWISNGLRRCFPSVDADTLRLLEGLMFDQSKLKFTTVTRLSILNGAHQDSKLRYWRTALAAIKRHPSRPGCGEIPADPFSEEAFLEDIAVRTEMAVLCDEMRNVARVLLVPDRLAADSKTAKSMIAGMRARWLELVARRESQWAVWRPGVNSKKEADYRAHFAKLADELVSLPDEAPSDEWLLEADLAMIDTHGRPECRAEALVEGRWIEMFNGIWKPSRSDNLYAAKLFPVKLRGKPEALRLSCCGYGDCGLCHVSLRNRDGRYVPAAVRSVSGRVVDAENLLVDDYQAMRFGLPDATAALLDFRKAREVSSLELSLVPLREMESCGTWNTLPLSFEKPLSSGHLNFCDNLRRFDIALSRPMDLSKASGVSFELKCMDPSVVENVWLLFKSGAGYYRAAAEVPKAAGEWTKTTVAKADVRLYHWDAHMSLWEKFERPEEKDLPDWSRVEGFQVVVAIDIDATSKDASVSARGFAPVAGPLAGRPDALPAKRIAKIPGERRLICTHVWGIGHDWDRTCKELAKYGITDVSPLISHGGYAYYKTRFGVEHPLVAKHGDALRLSIDACHGNGMKCHPRRSCWSLGFHAPAEVLSEFRRAGRLQVGFDGKDGAWLCPTHPDNLRREVEGMLELAEAGADGIMVDFFRYPGPDYCFCERCRKRFESVVGRAVEPWPQAVRSDPALARSWAKFRCDTMSEAFDEVARQVKASAPRLELSAAVSATVKGGEDRGQDWPRWCRDGGLDVLYPMCYYSTEKMLKRDLVGLKAAVAGTRTKLVPIIAFASGDIPIVEPAAFARQIETLRENGIRDLAFFRLQEYAPSCLEAVFLP